MNSFNYVSFLIKALLVVILLCVSGLFYYKYTIKDEQIKTLTSENNSLRSDNSNLKSSVKSQADQLVKLSAIRDSEDKIIKDQQTRLDQLGSQLTESKNQYDTMVSKLLKAKPNDKSVTCSNVDMDSELYNWMLDTGSSGTGNR